MPSSSLTPYPPCSEPPAGLWPARFNRSRPWDSVMSLGPCVSSWAGQDVLHWQRALVWTTTVLTVGVRGMSCTLAVRQHSCAGQDELRWQVPLTINTHIWADSGWCCLCRELDMSNCSGLTDEALETLANSITASRAQEVPEIQPQDAEAAQLGDLSMADALGSTRAGTTSRFFIQVDGCQGI